MTDSLGTRVQQFNTMSLPGQPSGMHMGTSYLVNDLWSGHQELLAALEKATHELNAIRARDGAPQHISWDRGHPIQTDSCTHEYWDALTEQCFTAIAKARG